MTTPSPAVEDASSPRRPLVIRALAYIGLDLTGPSPATPLEKGLALLYIFIPIALAGQGHLGVGGLWLFMTSALAIVPLAKLLGTATEELAVAHRPGGGRAAQRHLRQRHRADHRHLRPAAPG